MRILIASQNFFQPNNGQAVFTANLSRGLEARGWEVLVLTPAEGRRGAVVASDNPRVRSISARSLAPFYSDVYVTFRPDREVRAAFDEFQPHVVHLQDHFPLCRAVLRAARRPGVDAAVVATNHFLPENIVPFIPVLSRFAPTRRIAERVLWGGVLRVFNHVDAAASPTQTAAAILQAEGVSLDVRAISCGLDLSRFAGAPATPEQRRELRMRLGLDPERPLLVFVGRLDREKRLDVLIRALGRLASRPCEAGPGSQQPPQLAIVGRGRDAESLKALARDLDLGGSVVFTGFVTAEDHAALLRAADLFAMPSEAELQSIATLEAMAAGLPVLAARARALPELVEAGANGLLFAPGDPDDAAHQLAALLRKRSCWPAMAAESRQRAAAHALDATIAAYEEMYSTVRSKQ